MTTKVVEKRLPLKETSGGSAISCRISCIWVGDIWYTYPLGIRGFEYRKKGSTQGWEQTKMVGFLSAFVTDCAAPHAF